MGTHMAQAAEKYEDISVEPALVFIVKFVLKRDGGKLWASLTWPRMAISGWLF